MKLLLLSLGAFALGYLAASINTNEGSTSDVRQSVTSQSISEIQDPTTTPVATVSEDLAANWLDSDYGGSWSQFIDHLVTLAPKTDAFSTAWQKINGLSLPGKRSLLLAALEYGKRGQVKGLISNLMYNLAKEDMPRAQKMFEELSPLDRAHFGTTFLYGWANGDSKGAWDWLNAVDRSTTGSFLRTDTILQIKRAAITGMLNDPNNDIDVLELALNEKDIVFAEQSLDVVIQQFIQKDMEETLTLIDSHPEIADTIVKKAIEHWARSDLPQAASFLMANEDIASAESAAIVGEMMILNSASENLPQLYTELERPELKEQLALVAAGHSAQQNLNESIKWIDSIQTSRTKRQAATHTLHKLGFNDNMDTHIQFLETTLGTSADARPVYVQSLREWQKTYPDRVDEYVDSLPAEASELREQLIWQLNLNLETKD